MALFRVLVPTSRLPVEPQPVGLLGPPATSLEQLLAGKIVSTPDGTFAVLQGPQWPQRCPCCGLEADTVLALEFEKSRGGGPGSYVRQTRKISLEAPYCTACLRHEDKAWNARFFAFFLATVIGGSGYAGVLASATNPGGVDWPNLGLSALIVCLAVVLFMSQRWYIQGKLRRQTRPSCTRASGWGEAMKRAVLCCGWQHGSHIFYFANADYAAAFAEANEAQPVKREATIAAWGSAWAAKYSWD